MVSLEKEEGHLFPGEDKKKIGSVHTDKIFGLITVRQRGCKLMVSIFSLK